MEHINVQLSSEMYDQSLRGTAEVPALRECGDLSIYVKPGATVGGRPGAVITFTVELSDGTKKRAQAVTTVALLDLALSSIRGWNDGGHLRVQN